jgi:NTP pyrophosphatase (non-canonical NTP hydrolase)
MNRFEGLNNRSIEWAKAKGIFEHGTDIGQAKKVVEEAKELLTHVKNFEQLHYDDKLNHIKDDIGDVLNATMIMAKRMNLDPLDCYEEALKVVEARSGKMVNGQFKKDE